MSSYAQAMKTEDQLLDIAERHFAAYGFAGTTLRGIIKEAGVNVAAIAYHFGDKEELFAAVIERFAKPVVQQQLRQLEQVLSQEQVSLADVLLAFYAPPILLVKKLGKKGEALSQFLGRAQSEAEPVASIVDRHYAFCRQQFLLAFDRVLPHLDSAEKHWYFEFMLSLIVCFLTRQKIIHKRYSKDSDWDTEEVTVRLVAFCQAGMLAPLPVVAPRDGSGVSPHPL